MPHVQLTQTSPEPVREELTRWMASAFPHTVTGPSEISDPGKARAWIAATFPGAPVAEDIPGEQALALFLDGVDAAPGSVLLPPRLSAEFAHIHPDGSLHLALSEKDQDELVGKGWGERHPLHSPSVNVVMLYAPRTVGELEVARTVLGFAYRYAIGEVAAAV